MSLLLHFSILSLIFFFPSFFSFSNYLFVVVKKKELLKKSYVFEKKKLLEMRYNILQVRHCVCVYAV